MLQRNAMSLVVTLSVVALLATPAATLAAGLGDFNRVANPTVESENPPGTPEFWTPSSAGLADAIWENAVSLSPTHSLSLDDSDSSNSAAWESAAFTVRPGELLTLRYYVAYFGVSGGSFATEVEFLDADGQSVGLALDDYTGSFGGGISFEPRSVRVTVPANAESARIRCESGGSPTGLAFLDDISLDGNLLLNGDAEDSNGAGTSALDWFVGGSTSWVQVADAPSGFSVLRIEDTDPGAATTWRSKGVDLRGYAELEFGAQSKRSGLVGEAQVLLRFGTGVDEIGNLTGPLAGLDVVIPLTGDTVGFEAVSAAGVTIPDGATHADLRLTTSNDLTTTGTLDFDDAFIVPTVFVPRLGDLNNDGKRDQQDAYLMLDCIGGPGNPALCGEPEATLADLDEDGDVDLLDLADATTFTGEPENFVFNPSYEIDRGDGVFPLQWFISSEVSGQTKWFDAENPPGGFVGDPFDYVISGTHSAMIDDQSSTNFENTEWRSSGVFLPVGTRTVQASWNWRYEDVDGDFYMTLAFWTDVDEFGNAAGAFLGEESYLTEQGDSAGWETPSLQISVPVHPLDPALPVSFDIRFRAWGQNGNGSDDATGKMWIDDVAVYPLP
jgi:hypothetical protein